VSATSRFARNLGKRPQRGRQSAKLDLSGGQEGRRVVVAEEAHEKGREGVTEVKRWLEATMRFDVRYTIYDQVARVSLPLLNGSVKRYDMVAQHFNDDRERTASGVDVFVEVKNVGALSTALKQDKQFIEFVATAYSALEAGFDALGRDPGYEFMFATKHPWDVNNYLKFVTPQFVTKCCADHGELVPGDRVDETRAAQLAEKLWIWIIPKRQNDMTMGRAHLGFVWNALKGGVS
jgi:hypothetical protein